MLEVSSMSEVEDQAEGSTLLVALHVVMWSTLACGVIAILVVALFTR
jgi:hypothetical protein